MHIPFIGMGKFKFIIIIIIIIIIKKEYLHETIWVCMNYHYKNNY